MNRIKAATLVSAIVFYILFTPACHFRRDGQMNNHFADNGFGNPLGFIQHPNAEYYKGITYVTYQGPHEDPYVCAYDHDKLSWSGPVKAGVNLMGKTPDPVDNAKVDNHGRPALVLDAEGYVHLVFGGHGGYNHFGENPFGRHGIGKQTHVVSKRPEDISEWEELDNISPFGTYNQLIKMDNGDIYLFYRHGSHKSDWVYQKSTDNGRTFESVVSVLQSKIRADSNTHDAWYAHFTRGPGNTIMAMYVYHACAEVNHSRLRENVYYMKMNCADGSWENATGQRLVAPVTKEQADLKTLVFHSRGLRCNHGLCRFDRSGIPHLLFKYKKERIWSVKWLGDRWQDPVMVTDTSTYNQHADMIIRENGEIDMLISGYGINGGGEVCWWHGRDGGLTWTKGRTILSDQRVTYDISTRTKNYHPDGMFGIFEKDPASPNLYRRIYLWGEDGFVTRED